MSGHPWSYEPLEEMPAAADVPLEDGARSEAPDDVEPGRDSAPKSVTRRQALKVLGIVPVAIATGTPLLAQATGTQAPRQPHATPNQPANPARNPPTPSSSAKRHFFTAREMRTVHVLADDILPRDARSGSASEVGVPAFIDFHLSLPETSEDTRVQVRGGLRWLDTESRRRVNRPFASASPAQRHALLDDIAFPETARPELSQGVAFFSRFRDMVASGFFSSRQGWEDLRYMGNVFNPAWKGCPDAALRRLGVTQAVMSTRIPPQ